MRRGLTLFLIIECALIGFLLVGLRMVPQPDGCTWSTYFQPPEPPISRLEGLSQ